MESDGPIAAICRPLALEVLSRQRQVKQKTETNPSLLHHCGGLGEIYVSVFLCVVFSMETIMKKYMVVFHGAKRSYYFDTLDEMYKEVEYLGTEYSIFECVLDDGHITNWIQVTLYLATTRVSV